MNIFRRGGLKLTLAASLLLCGWLTEGLTAWAGEVDSTCYDRDYTLNLGVENDLWGGGSDQHFTHGSRISFVESKEAAAKPADCSPEERESGGLDLFRYILNPIQSISDFNTDQVSLILGQSIFTPESISSTNLETDDRPYAGWLYIGLGLINRHKSGDTWVFDTLEIDLGLVGPESYAEDIQKWWHEDVSNSPRPRGWGHQLRNEPGLMINLERKWRRELTPKNYEGLQVDVLPSVGVALGNVLTYGSAGVMFRLGVNLPIDYGPPRIRPGAQGSDFFKYDRKNPVSWYFFGGVEGRAVAYNVFLDGNTFTSSHSVGKKPLVGDFHAGVVVAIYRFRLAFSQIFRTPEFDGQEEADEFGSISLSVSW